MKPISPAPAKVPRLNSLLHRLQQTPGPEDDPYLDQLMMFLDDPPPDVANRWVKGAEMCAAWGITCSHTAVYRLFRSHAPQWRAQSAANPVFVSETAVEEFRQKSAHLLALRLREIVADPDATPTTLVAIARIELSRQKHMEGKGGDTERALKTLGNRTWFNWEAQLALTKLREALGRKSTKPSPFPPGYLDACTAFPNIMPPK